MGVGDGERDESRLERMDGASKARMTAYSVWAFLAIDGDYVSRCSIQTMFQHQAALRR